MMRVGLLGASRIAPNAIIEPAAARDDVVITAVAARDGGRASDYAARHAIPVALDSYAALVARDDVDLVYCALPPQAHSDVCRAALAAGKMLLVEKPFAADMAAAISIVEAATAAGQPALEAFHYRFHDQFAHAERLVRSDALGAMIRAEGVFSTMIPRVADELRWDAACGGGAMMDLGCYIVHALRTLLGSEPEVRHAEARRYRGVDVSTAATLSFRDVPATLYCAMDAPTEARIVLEGTDGTLTLENFVTPQFGGKLMLRTTAGVETVPASGPSSYSAQLSHVIDVWAGRAAPITGGADAVATMRVIDACSAATSFSPSSTPAGAP